MEEIKVNDYIRTKDGIIGKVIQKEHNIINDEDFYRIQVSSDYTTLVTLEKLYKHSPNIIDLIEVEDYVNGYKVKYVCNEEPCPSGKYVDVDCELDSSESYFFDNEIKSICTKEQFANAEYRLED